MAVSPENSLSADEVSRLKALLRQTGEFIAYFEMAESKMNAWREEVKTAMENFQANNHSELSKLSEQTQQMSELMTEVGIARWRQAQTQLLTQGQDHLSKLKHLSDRNLEQFRTQKKELLDVANQAINNFRRSEALLSHKLNSIIKKAKFDEISDLSIELKDDIEQATQASVKQYQSLFKNVRLKTAALIFSVTVVSTVSMCLFLNAETPWEIHSHAKEERLVGKALLHAWPHLSASLRTDILHKLHLKKI